ncbi:MAG: hypothetical protein M0Z99_17060 [Betaproteobacteria bacterium]|nr:hypothetical protein [Betaproteobacteria bacterium]
MEVLLDSENEVSVKANACVAGVMLKLKRKRASPPRGQRDDETLAIGFLT